MRQIFTSQRLETVEGVALLLEENGVETYTSNRRSYKGQRRGEFSYATPTHEPQPGVWVIRADDLVKARHLLRTAGLLESTQTGSYLPAFDAPTTQVAAGGRSIAMRLRLALLTTVTVLAAITTARMFGWF